MSVKYTERSLMGKKLIKCDFNECGKEYFNERHTFVNVGTGEVRHFCRISCKKKYLEQRIKKNE